MGVRYPVRRGQLRALCPSGDGANAKLNYQDKLSDSESARRGADGLADSLVSKCWPAAFRYIWRQHTSLPVPSALCVLRQVTRCRCTR